MGFLVTDLGPTEVGSSLWGPPFNTGEIQSRELFIHSHKVRLVIFLTALP